MEQHTLPIEEQSLFDRLCTTNTLSLAFKEVRKNKGAPGIDGVTIKDFQAKLNEELVQLKAELESWHYKPTPVVTSHPIQYSTASFIPHYLRRKGNLLSQTN